jgi:hypothetical protein
MADQKIGQGVAVGDPNNPDNWLVPSWSNAVAVPKSDSTVYDPSLKSLWVGGVGDVAVRMKGSQTIVTFTAVAAGTRLPVNVDKVMSTNTSATLIVGLY